MWWTEPANHHRFEHVARVVVMPATRRSQRAGLGPFVLAVLPCPLTFDSLGFTGASTFVHTMEIGMRQMNGHYGVP